MAGVMTMLNRLKIDFDLLSSKTRLRLDLQQREIEELRERLDKYDLPASSSPGKLKKRPVPVPERPDSMVAADVGDDPRQ